MLETTHRRKEYEGNGASTVFGYDFLLFAAADLKVYVDGVQLALTTDYTVSGVGDPLGGSVTFVVAPPVPSTPGVKNVILFAETPPTAAVDLVENDSFPAESVERNLQDRLVALIQEMQEALARTIVVSRAVPDGNNDLPTAPVPGKFFHRKADNSGYDWIDAFESLANPMTLAADLIIGGPLGAPLRLPKGADDTVLSVIAGALGYRLIPTASLADGAVTAPKLAAGLAFTTGDVKPTLKAVADSGWVMLNDGSIGNAASGATTRAHADTEALFTLIWNNITDAWAPVSGGRGASAAADFAANKTLVLPKALGRALAGAGAGAGLTARALGEALGEQDVALTVGQLPPHDHSLTLSRRGGTTFGAGQGWGADDQTSGTALQTTTQAGAGEGHPNMQPTLFVNWMVKL